MRAEVVHPEVHRADDGEQGGQGVDRRRPRGSLGLEQRDECRDQQHGGRDGVPRGGHPAEQYRQDVQHHAVYRRGKHQRPRGRHQAPPRHDSGGGQDQPGEGRQREAGAPDVRAEPALPEQRVRYRAHEVPLEPAYRVRRKLPGAGAGGEPHDLYRHAQPEQGGEHDAVPVPGAVLAPARGAHEGERQVRHGQDVARGDEQHDSGRDRAAGAPAGRPDQHPEERVQAVPVQVRDRVQHVVLAERDDHHDRGDEKPRQRRRQVPGAGRVHEHGHESGHERGGDGQDGRGGTGRHQRREPGDQPRNEVEVPGVRPAHGRHRAVHLRVGEEDAPVFGPHRVQGSRARLAQEPHSRTAGHREHPEQHRPVSTDSDGGRAGEQPVRAGPQPVRRRRRHLVSERSKTTRAVRSRIRRSSHSDLFSA